MLTYNKNMDHYRWAYTGDFPECISQRNAMDITGDSSVVSLCPIVLPRSVRGNFLLGYVINCLCLMYRGLLRGTPDKTNYYSPERKTF